MLSFYYDSNKKDYKNIDINTTTGHLIFPDTCIIDNINQECYESLSSEYDHPSHETCRDFDRFTYVFLKHAVDRIGFNYRIRYLDVGVGTGTTLIYLADWLKKTDARVEVLDISASMLMRAIQNYNGEITAVHHTSIHSFYSAPIYDLVMASMSDPYLTPSALETLKSILSPKGALIVTFPHSGWASAVREVAKNKTIFHDKNNFSYPSYSFCWSSISFIKYLEELNFELVFYEEFFLDPEKKMSAVNENFIAHIKHKVPFFSGFIFYKREGDA